MNSLILIVFVIAVSVDVEVAQFVSVMSGGHHSKPVTQIVLLEVTFC